MPAAVQAVVDDLAAMCREAGGTPDIEDAVRRVDLNQDGHVDFVVFAGNARCTFAASFYGDREKLLVVFAADGNGGATEAFSDAVFGAEIEESDDGPKLWLTTMAGQCGKPRAEYFSEESFCDRAIEWNRDTGRFQYAPLSTVRMIE